MKQLINSKDIVRVLPAWAEVDRVINHTPIYNMSVFDNIMSFNQHNLDGEAIDYFGTKITYGDLPAIRDAYARGLKLLGINEGDVVTLCLPVSIENLMLLFAINLIGAVSNNVNFLYLKHDFSLYTQEKKSKVVITLNAYLPYFVDHLKDSGVEKVLIMDLDDYLPDHKKGMFRDVSRMPEKMKKVFNFERIVRCLMGLDTIRNVQFMNLKDVFDAGKDSSLPLPYGPVDMDRDTTYFYTSGTTGDPKCVVYKEKSVNAYLEMHAGLDTKDYVGQRCFQVIPLTHMTGERVCTYLPMARGGTLVPQPIYNKNTFAEDLARTKCNYVVAAASFYMAAVKQGNLRPDALKHLRRPASGGEPATKSGVEQIDNWLKENGCNVRYSLGGGASEEGGATLTTYFMDEETKTNETGKPLEPFIRIKLLDEDGNVIRKPGVMGYMHATTPACADRYLDNEEATARRWYYDEFGTRWGNTGDMAVLNSDGSYNIMGRETDSYINEHGERVFLFEIEYSLDSSDPIVEWEITAFKVNEPDHKPYDVVAQIVPKTIMSLNSEKKADIVRKLCAKYKLDGVKFYEEFKIGEITGKRDYLFLQADYSGYFAPCSKNHLYEVNYSENGTVERTKIRDDELSDRIQDAFKKAANEEDIEIA